MEQGRLAGIGRGMTPQQPLATAPVPVIVNAGGGAASKLGGKLEQALAEAFRAAGLEPRLSLVRGEDIAEAVRRAEGPMVAVGGGDGTLGAAAGVLAETGQALAILPLGTRNHLARALGVPLDLEGAVQVAARGEERRIDLGLAGERIFVNNCSVGLYPRLVLARDQAPAGVPKWLATIPAAFSVLRTLRVEHFRLEWGGAEHRLETPLLFIGNNRYALDRGRLGERESLSDGVLSVAAVAAPGPMGLAATALRLLAGLSDPDCDFAALEDVEELCIYGHHVRRIALDGELVRMKFPLRLKTMPGALRVKVPFPQQRGDQ